MVARSTRSLRAPFLRLQLAFLFLGSQCCAGDRQLGVEADLSDDLFEQLRLRPLTVDVALYEQDGRAGVDAGADGRRLVTFELL